MSETETKKMSLTTKILIAMISGIAVGILINTQFANNVHVQTYFVGGILDVIGSIFVASLKMMVVPLVFVSLICGVTSLGDPSALGRLGLKALALYLFTTAVAVSIALSLAVSIGPGQGFDNTTEVVYEAKQAPPLSDVIKNIVPSNPIEAMAQGNMLQIIVFALLFGVAITLSGERGKHVFHFFTDLNEVVMKMVEILMKLAPIGVFALISKTFATQGLDIIMPLISYFLVVAGALLAHALGTFSILFRVFTGLNPLTFLKKMRPPLLFAFSTASSGATLPITLNAVTKRLGVSNSVGSFTVPLGATINMDGTAIMQGVATVFIANVYGIDLGLVDYLTVVITATLASVGTAAVPGVGLIMLAMVLNQVGLPVEGIALIIGVDRLLDMMRTAVNVTGDGMVSCVIAKSEGALDVKTFNDPDAGLETTKT
jgi:DAACS family dicarboxylate/amino acid:cation (Na+ or H+) symporter